MFAPFIDADPPARTPNMPVELLSVKATSPSASTKTLAVIGVPLLELSNPVAFADAPILAPEVRRILPSAL